MREDFDVLDELGIDWFVTGSEAAACYGVLRQTFDTDVVIDLQPTGFDRVARALPGFAIASPVEFDDFAMASVVSTETAAKVDLIMRRPGPYASRSMARRRRCDHREFGEIWVSESDRTARMAELRANGRWAGGVVHRGARPAARRPGGGDLDRLSAAERLAA